MALEKGQSRHGHGVRTDRTEASIKERRHTMIACQLDEAVPIDVFPDEVSQPPGIARTDRGPSRAEEQLPLEAGAGRPGSG